MKKTRIIFWITTTLIFLFEGVMTAFTSQTEMARQGITSLGYPVYFGTILAIFKVAGTLILMIPAFSPRIKEWAYVGFGFDFIFAFLSLVIVNGFNAVALFPIACLVVLIFSYRTYHTLKQIK